MVVPVDNKFLHRARRELADIDGYGKMCYVGKDGSSMLPEGVPKFL